MTEVTQPLSRWARIANGFDDLAEICNIGIVAQILPKVLGGLLAAAALPWLSWLAVITDPMIYLFRACGRLTRVIGRKGFGIDFPDEPSKPHPRQTALELLSVGFFLLSIVSFAAAILCPPFIFVAWSFGLAGISLVYKFKYCQNEKVKLEELNTGTLKPEIREPSWIGDKLNKLFGGRLGQWVGETKTISPEDIYKEHKHARQLYFYILMGLGVMLLCGSATLFAPPLLIPALGIASKLAGFYLAGINIGRIINALRPGFLSTLWERCQHLFGLKKDNVVTSETDTLTPPRPSLNRSGSYDGELRESGIFPSRRTSIADNTSDSEDNTAPLLVDSHRSASPSYSASCTREAIQDNIFTNPADTIYFGQSPAYK